jgi:selenide,water dikinase
MGFAPRPKAGVFAVRAAPVLHHNLRAALSGGRRKAFKPQKNYLKLISLGAKSAMAEKYGLTLSGPFMWRWKDRIDRAFMDRLGALPVMGPEEIQGPAAQGLREMREAKPMCGGCGAKVGGGVLGDALAELPKAQGDIVAGAGDDAAILKAGDGFQVISTDHLRAFVADPAQMARIAAVHALGDIWAMGAQPQVMLSQVILPQMSAVLQARTLAEITQAAQDVAGVAGAQVVGGHTSMGAELTIGFTVTGTCARMPITNGGAKAGDTLILTRPLGSGVIMAALMQGVADGRVVARTLQVMQDPQHREAKVLKTAHAMTDVTGFGLAGHVQVMARASGLDAVLWRDRIPVYEGARALSEAGVASSLMPVNRADAQVQGEDDALLYDPQTAGGLLAAVASEQVEATLAALQAAGCEGHAIGQFEAGVGNVTLKAS